MPKRIRPALAYPAREAPAGDRWLHEVKLDGYRMICRLQRGQVTFVSRHGIDWTDPLKSLVPTVAKLPARQAVLDGEAVVLGADGVTRLALLQRAWDDAVPSASITTSSISCIWMVKTSRIGHLRNARPGWPNWSIRQGPGRCVTVRRLPVTVPPYLPRPAGWGWRGSSPNVVAAAIRAAVLGPG